MSTDNSEDSIFTTKKAEAFSSSAFTPLFFVPLHE